MRKERGNYRNPLMRRVTRLSSAERRSRPGLPNSPVAGSPSSSSPTELSPEQLIGRIMEAEPPEIYLMKDMKRPLTEANVMMSLTNLADKELVHMISWAKKIPGTPPHGFSSCRVGGNCPAQLYIKTPVVITGIPFFDFRSILLLKLK